MRLGAALRQAMPAPEYETLEELIEDVPAIRELAELWSGESSGRAYLSARRRFERYFAGAGHAKRGGRQTRAPRDLEDFLDQFRGRVEEQRRRRKSEGVGVSILGTLRVSKDERRRRIEGDLSGDCVDEIQDALDQDDEEGAADAFEECFGNENRFGATPHWIDVEELDLA